MVSLLRTLFRGINNKYPTGCTAISPACERALGIVVDTLQKHGHEVFDVYVFHEVTLLDSSLNSSCLLDLPQVPTMAFALALN